MLVTLSAENWTAIVELSDAINSSREKINAVWEAAAEAGKFIAASARVVDGDKGVVDAEPRPTPEYVKQKQILMYADGLRALDPEVREKALELATTVVPKLDLANMLSLVQEGATAEAAFKAVPEYDADAEADMADAVIASLTEGATPN